MYNITVTPNTPNAKRYDIVGSERLCNRLMGLEYLGGFKRFNCAIQDDKSSDSKTPKETIKNLIGEVFTQRELPKVKEFLNGFITL